MAVDPKQVMTLREKTNAGVMDCRKALETANGDMTKAEALIKAKGLENANKAGSRATKQGKVGSYIHQEGKGGSMVELCCETDFVARGEAFTELLRELCIQVYAMAPKYVSREEIPAQVVEDLKASWKNDLEGKPAEAQAKIIQGKLDKNLYSKEVLLDQVFVKDTEGKLTVGEMIKAKIGVMKENIVVRRFARYEIGA